MPDLPQYEKDDRPWGTYERFTLNERTTVKLITVAPNEAFSLQTHEHRAEFWRFLTGTATVTVGDHTHSAKAGDQFYIPMGTRHRAEAGPGGVVFLEISFGQFAEQDIIRIEDRYGRP